MAVSELRGELVDAGEKGLNGVPLKATAASCSSAARTSSASSCTSDTGESAGETPETERGAGAGGEQRRLGAREDLHGHHGSHRLGHALLVPTRDSLPQIAHVLLHELQSLQKHTSQFAPSINMRHFLSSLEYYCRCAL